MRPPGSSNRDRFGHFSSPCGTFWDSCVKDSRVRGHGVTGIEIHMKWENDKRKRLHSSLGVPERVHCRIGRIGLSIRSGNRRNAKRIEQSNLVEDAILDLHWAARSNHNGHQISTASEFERFMSFRNRKFDPIIFYSCSGRNGVWTLGSRGPAKRFEAEATAGVQSSRERSENFRWIEEAHWSNLSRT